MKKEVTETMEWIAGLVAKFGILIGLVVAIYYGVKKVWFWCVMPSMLFVSLNMFGNIFGWGWVKHLDIKAVVVSWVFLFALLSHLFVRDNK